VEQSNDPSNQNVIYVDLGTNIEHACPNSNCEPSNDEYHPIFKSAYDLFVEKGKSEFLNIVQRFVEFFNTYSIGKDSEKIAINIIHGDA
jgi:hypothetical protein